MATRWCALTSLGLSLLFVTGCPEPGEDAGDDLASLSDESESGDTDTTDPTADDDESGGVEEGGDVRPPLDTGDGDGDEGDGDGDGDGDDAGDGDGDGDGDGPFDDPERCWDRSQNEVPALIFDNTIGRTDDGTATCGIGPSPDFQLGFMAPWAGSFTFDTEGSSFDTVVYVHEKECGKRELGCNDDFIGLDSKLTLELEAFELITITVDGTGPFEEGPLVLSIYEATPPTCESEKLNPPLPKQIVGNTTDGLNELVSECGGEGAPERVFEFHAPGPGTYRFSTEGSSFDTVLYTLEQCADAPITCNDDSNFELHSELIVDLDGGDKLLLVVDGHDDDDMGEFMLTVDEL